MFLADLPELRYRLNPDRMEDRAMKKESELRESPPRRKFLAGLVAGVTASAAFLLAPRKARAGIKKATSPGGPILYRRTEETERYYRTLYR